MTVADYFKRMAREHPIYKQFMGGNRLRFPFLPTVNVGSFTKPILFPMELISVCHGQSCAATKNMMAEALRHSAIRPQERFQNLLGSGGGGKSANSMLTELCHNDDSKCFGVTNFDKSAPMSVAARVLPPPKLQYGGEVISPRLSGEWNMMTQGRRPTQFVELPPSPNPNKSYTYGILIVGSPPRNWHEPTRVFKQALEKDASGAGLDLFLGGVPELCSGA